jgi:DNA-binding NtrC family response regulator
MKTTILVIDDEPSVRESLTVALEDEHDIITVGSGKEAVDLLSKSNADVVLLDVLMPDMDGIATLKAIKAIDEHIQVIMLTAKHDIRTAVESIKLGAFDYICKPFKLEELRCSIARALKVEELERENVYLRTELKSRLHTTPIVGESKTVRDIMEIAQKIAPSDSTVLISGETGTGKELIAKYIWHKSSRSQRPFVVINCATIPHELMESELFGHEKGAFTSAFSKKIGKFEMASTGTVFLDEIGSLSLNLQTKFLRVIQEKTIERVGGQRCIPVDVRFIAATNQDLKKAIKEKTFREDLFYRLNVVPIYAPPLRERPEDIPLLVDHFLKQMNRNFSKKVKAVSDDVMDVFTHYQWPGNIRELENLMERLVVLSTDEIIPLHVIPRDVIASDIEVSLETPGEELDLKTAKHNFEKRLIEKVMILTNDNIQEAAKILGVHRATVMNKIQELGLTRHKSLTHT